MHHHSSPTLCLSLASNSQTASLPTVHYSCVAQAGRRGLSTSKGLIPGGPIEYPGHVIFVNTLVINTLVANTLVVNALVVDISCLQNKVDL